jgi:hypothetical protein
MAVRLLYLIVIRVLGWLVLVGRRQAFKDAEIMSPPAECGPPRERDRRALDRQRPPRVPGPDADRR